jgi:hypothetical protein
MKTLITMSIAIPLSCIFCVGVDALFGAKMAFASILLFPALIAMVDSFVSSL